MLDCFHDSEIQTFRMAVIGDLYPKDMHEIIRCVNDYLGIEAP